MKKLPSVSDNQHRRYNYKESQHLLGWVVFELGISLKKKFYKCLNFILFKLKFLSQLSRDKQIQLIRKGPVLRERKRSLLV